MLYWLIGNPEGFPLHSAMIAGMLLASTSPATAGILLKTFNAPKRLTNILLGESLFNGLVAIMLFFFLLSLNTEQTSDWSLPKLTGQLIYIGASSIAIGMLVGWLLIQLMRITKKGYRHTIITQAGCFLSYYIAYSLFEASGVAALLPTALMFLHYMQKTDSADCLFTRAVWDYKRYLASGILHIMMGLSLTFALFSQQWLAMLIGIGAALTVRALVVFLVLPPVRRLLSKQALDRSYCTVLWWGGMRGGTTIALALSLPEDLTGWWTIQAIAYGAVLFSTSFQAAYLPTLINRANVKANTI